MDIRQQIVDCALLLLEKKLVARTWGNVSARVDDNHYLITPSGLSYNRTRPKDIVLCDMTTTTFEGELEPSSEWGIHDVAYKAFHDCEFVIHTHQTFASAFSLTGIDDIILTTKEEEDLGGIMVADYGLPGTKRLRHNVEKCYKNKAHCVLMEHHGAVVVGTSMEDAIRRVELLEEVCRRSYRGHNLSEKATAAYSRLGIPLKAQLDDMAQMIGPSIDVITSDPKRYLARNNKNAVIVKNRGIAVLGKDKEDKEALRVLVEKAAISALHTRYYGKKATLGFLDTKYMNYMYNKSYSKKKDANN